MRIALRPTAQLERIPAGHPARVWRGVTDGGVEIEAYICKISFSSLTPSAEAEFEKELAPLGVVQYEMDHKSRIDRALIARGE